MGKGSCGLLWKLDYPGKWDENIMLEYMCFYVLLSSTNFLGDSEGGTVGRGMDGNLQCSLDSVPNFRMLRSVDIQFKQIRQG